ncbi:MAG: hypothetical protein F6K49_43955 [Moorea sp. SIO3I6]|nr:hypothetical protein [Moorena sp. SIO3I6]NEP99513.1 hypothetical protein [Moorena sp. SIO3F7]
MINHAWGDLSSTFSDSGLKEPRRVVEPRLPAPYWQCQRLREQDGECQSNRCLYKQKPLL